MFVVHENRRAWLLGSTLGLLGGCYGGLRSDDRPPFDNDDPPASAESTAAGADSGSDAAPPVEPSATVLRRLTNFEYNNTIADLLGDDLAPAREFAEQARVDGFENNAEALTVSPILAEQYLLAAETLAARAVGDLEALLPCAITSPDDACVDAFIADFGTRAWRRPLDEIEVQALRDVFETGRRDGFDQGVALVIQTALSAPDFLFRVEHGPVSEGSAPRRLSSYETASRLSYALWGTMPDAALFGAAAADGLVHAADIEAHARRMLDDPRAERAIDHFVAQWLDLDAIESMSKSAEVYPSFAPERRDALRSEVAAFVRAAIWSPDGGVDALYTKAVGYLDAPLAELYGVAPPEGEGLQPVALDPEQRSGLLTRMGLLAALAGSDQSSPTLRGVFIRERLLCQSLPPPPPDLDNARPARRPDATTRERVEAHLGDPSCAVCHTLIDPLGFTLEHYDGIGRYRPDENGRPIDASAEIVDSDLGELTGARALGQALAASVDARRCIAQRWFEYSMGRTMTAADEATVTTLGQTLDHRPTELRELLVAITLTDAFQRR